MSRQTDQYNACSLALAFCLAAFPTQAADSVPAPQTSSFVNLARMLIDDGASGSTTSSHFHWTGDEHLSSRASRVKDAPEQSSRQRKNSSIPKALKTGANTTPKSAITDALWSGLPMAQFELAEDDSYMLSWPSTQTLQEPSGKNSTSTVAGRSPRPDPLGYRYAMDKQMSLNAGVGWIADLKNPLGMSPSLDEASGELSDKRSGVNLNLGASFGAVTLTGGYIRALDGRTPTQIAIEDKSSAPTAWNSEIAYSTELLRRETTLAVGYQKYSEALYDTLPEQRYRTSASMALSDSTTFSLEYYQDRDESGKNGGQENFGITTKIGVGF